MPFPKGKPLTSLIAGIGLTVLGIALPETGFLSQDHWQISAFLGVVLVCWGVIAHFRNPHYLPRLKILADGIYPRKQITIGNEFFSSVPLDRRGETRQLLRVAVKNNGPGEAENVSLYIVSNLNINDPWLPMMLRIHNGAGAHSGNIREGEELIFDLVKIIGSDLKPQGEGLFVCHVTDPIHSNIKGHYLPFGRYNLELRAYATNSTPVLAQIAIEGSNTSDMKVEVTGHSRLVQNKSEYSPPAITPTQGPVIFAGTSAVSCGISVPIVVGLDKPFKTKPKDNQT